MEKENSQNKSNKEDANDNQDIFVGQSAVNVAVASSTTRNNRIEGGINVVMVNERVVNEAVDVVVDGMSVDVVKVEDVVVANPCGPEAVDVVVDGKNAVVVVVKGMDIESVDVVALWRNLVVLKLLVLLVMERMLMLLS